jgi:hypothetical protein
MFKTEEILHGLPREGQKITYNNVTKFALHRDAINNEKLLTIGESYTVKRVNLNSSSTYVCLEEFWIEGLDEYRNNQKIFNMHAFSWEKPKIEPSDLIGLNVRRLQALNRSYGYSIELFTGYIHVMTDSPIICNIDDNQFIVSAKYIDEN